MNVQQLANPDLAKMALLVMYAFDMCDQNLDPTSSILDARIAADGWNVIGIITGGDDIAVSGQSIRQQFMRAGSMKRYGYLAVSAANPAEYIAVVRGTDGAEEWLDDFDFVAKSQAPFSGKIESGFGDIYGSMCYFPLNSPNLSTKLADGIATAVPANASVTVLAHSLGSSLGTLLAYDLAAAARLGTGRTGGLFFASPKTGDHDFVDAFADLVTNYLVINYMHDVVPDVPPFDIFNLDIFRTLPTCRILMDSDSTAKINSADLGCCHHLIDYAALLSPNVFAASKSGWTSDDTNCAKCVSF